MFDRIDMLYPDGTAYKSQTNGENSYMYYAPVGIYDWELLIVAQEDYCTLFIILQLQYLRFHVESCMIM